jgi:hypothetical protein
MKKIMMILVVLVQTTLFAQSTKTTEKPLKLTSVSVGSLSDDVLLRGATDQIVKKISVNDLLVNKANINSPLFTGVVTSPMFVKSGGSSSQFLKANGSVDSNAYLTAIGGAISYTVTHTVSNSVALDLFNNSISYNIPSIRVTNNSSNNGISAAGIDITSTGVNDNNVGLVVQAKTTPAGIRIIGTNSNNILFEGQNAGVTTSKISRTGVFTGTAHNLFALNAAPTTATAIGTLGEIRFTASGIFICTATNTWIKCVGATF